MTIAYVALALLGLAAAYRGVVALVRLIDRAERHAYVDSEDTKPDIAPVLHPAERLCPCGEVFRRHPAVVEPLCNGCVAKRFEAAEAEDSASWGKSGVIVARNWQ